MPASSPKIDPRQTYPCPCRQSGQLQPIILTDSLGCDRCQQIFQINLDGDAIEQMAGTYPYRRTWYWQGQRWISERSRPQTRIFRWGVLLISTCLIAACAAIWLRSRSWWLAISLVLFLLSLWCLKRAIFSPDRRQS
ncbi:MAG: hypothetical protein AAFY57_14275 [Cyanobacteria bacterium J06642_2]